VVTGMMTTGLFRPLRFMDRRGIGQHDLVEFAELVGHLPAVEVDSDLAESGSIAVMKPRSPL